MLAPRLANFLVQISRTVRKRTGAMSIHNEGRNTMCGNGLGDEPNLVLEHVIECDVCMAVIASLRSPTSLCEVRCPEYRALIANEDSTLHLSTDSAVFLSAIQ